MARNATGMMQRLIPDVIDILNSKFDINIDLRITSSLIVMIQGVSVNVERLSRKYEIDYWMAQCFAHLFSAIFM